MIYVETRLLGHQEILEKQTLKNFKSDPFFS